jgi:hypothetical protein
MERAQGLGLGGGTGGNGIILLSLSFFLSFFLVLFVFLSPVICQQGRRVAGRELRHLAGSPGGGGDIRVLSYSNQSEYSMIKQQQQSGTGFCFETLATNRRAVAFTPPLYMCELSR